MERQSTWNYLKRLLLAVGVIGLFVILLLFFWAIADILLLLFTGVVLAVVLRTLAKPIARHTPLTDKWSLAVVVLLLVVLLGVGGWLFVPEVANQTGQLVEQVDNAINRIEAIVNQYGWAQALFGGIFPQDLEQLPLPDMLPRLTGTFTVTLRSLSHIFFVVFIGFFVAVDPELYRSGIVTLVPPRGRKRSREVIDGIVDGLRSWLLAQFISMIVVGIVTGVGLWILGIPLALLLGVFSGFLEFIPIAGPILSAVAPILIAFTIGPMRAVYVTLFYLVVQQLEGNLLTPIVQHKVVSLPPALTLTAVLVMGVLFGPLGVLVATPLAVVVFILVKMLYLEDILGSHRQDASPKKSAKNQA